MTGYLVVKWVHVLSSVLLVGTGFGSAFFIFFANRSGNVPAIAVVTRLVVRRHVVHGAGGDRRGGSR